MVKKFTIPFASQGDANDIPDALQVDGKVSFTQGFGYDYERPYDDPQAKDIAREDMNGLFKAITSAVGELQTLGASEWSDAISYPKGAIVYFEKDLYISQVDDNQNKPPQNWVSITSIANDSLKKVANLSDLTNKATARSNLGLGSSATLNKTDVLGTSASLVATQKLVNDTKVNLENSINTIENTSKTFLVKSSNLSDLTNKATARNNLGLGSSATLNKTDVLGTSTSLVATQKLVNDTKISLESSKQDKLTFRGWGDVLREGAYGVGDVASARNYTTVDQFVSNIRSTGGQFYRPFETEISGIKRYSAGVSARVADSFFGLFVDPATARPTFVAGTNTIYRSTVGLNYNDITDEIGSSSKLCASQKLVKTVKDSQLGVNQRLIDVTSGRAKSVDYTNNTGKTIFVAVSALHARSGETGIEVAIIVDGVESRSYFGGDSQGGSYKSGSVFMPIPAGSVYKIVTNGEIKSWCELR